MTVDDLTFFIVFTSYMDILAYYSKKWQKKDLVAYTD